MEPGKTKYQKILAYLRKILVYFGIAVLVAVVAASWFWGSDLIWFMNVKNASSELNSCRLSQAEKSLQKAVKAASNFSPSDPSSRWLMSALALIDVYMMQAKYPSAKTLLDEALDYAEKRNNTSDRVKVLGTYGGFYRRQGHYKEAMAKYEEAIELARADYQLASQQKEPGRIKDTGLRLAEALEPVAKLDIFENKTDAAEPLVKLMLDLRSKYADPKNDLGMASVELYTGLIAENRGQFGTARRFLDQARTIASSVVGPKSTQTLFIINDIAALEIKEGKLAEAKELTAQSIQLSDKDAHSYLLANMLDALRNMSEIQLQNGDTKAAASTINHQIEVARSRLSTDHPYYAIGIEHRGMLEGMNKQFDLSDKDFQESLEIFRKALGEPNSFSAQALLRLSLAKLEQNELGAAKNACDKALAMYESLLPPGHPDIAQAKLVLARILLLQHQEVEAHKLQKEAKQAFEEAMQQ